jgi:hypothetical protein
MSCAIIETGAVGRALAGFFQKAGVEVSLNARLDEVGVCPSPIFPAIRRRIPDTAAAPAQLRLAGPTSPHRPQSDVAATVFVQLRFARAIRPPTPDRPPQSRSVRRSQDPQSSGCRRGWSAMSPQAH